MTTEVRSDAAAPAQKAGRRRLYRLHAWVGFHLAFFMSLVLATGTLAVISNEIDWLLQDDMRVSPVGDKVGWAKMEAAVRAYASDDLFSTLSAGVGDHFAYRATMLDETGKRYFIHINQWTGEVTGTTHALTVQRFLRDLHRYLFMPGIIALPVVCSLAFALAVSLYTGLKTTRNWGKVAFRVRTNKGARIAVGDFHKAAGIWSIWFFVIVIVTSLWYLSEWGAARLGTSFEPNRPGVSAERVIEFGAVIKDADANTLTEAARAAFPGFEPTEILFAIQPNQSATVLGRHKDPLVRDRANRVFLDPVSADIVKVQKSTEIGPVAYLNEIADPLHFGFFGNLPTKIVWFVFGLSMTAMSLSGFWLTYKRLKSVHISRAQMATFPILLMGVIAGYFYISDYVSYDKIGTERILARASLDDLVAELRISHDLHTPDKNTVRLIADSMTGRPNIQSAKVIVNGDEVLKLDRQLLGRRVVYKGHIPTNIITAAQTRGRFVLETPDGTLKTQF